VEELQKKKREKDRQHSLRHYEYLKHKLEDEEGSAKKVMELKKLEEERVVRTLTDFERRMSKHQTMAD
jgi:hypothetical protein